MKNFIPVIIWAVIILFLSTSSSIKIPEALSGIVGTDKLGHLVIYAVFSILMFFGIVKNQKNIPGNTNALIVVGISSLYGVMMELMQFTFFTGRYFEVLDIIANIIGSFIGLFFAKFIFNKKL